MLNTYIYMCVCVCVWSSLIGSTEPKPNLFRCKNNVNIATSNIKTLNTINQLSKLRVSAAKQNIDIIYLHGYYHSKLKLKYHGTSNGWIFVLASAWKNFVNAATAGVEMLLSREWFVLHLMANSEQQLSYATVPLMPIMKQTSPPIMSYLPLFDTFPNTTFWSLRETWMLI